MNFLTENAWAIFAIVNFWMGLAGFWFYCCAKADVMHYKNQAADWRAAYYERDRDHDRLFRAICKHRDAKGHDRCQLNDRELYAVLNDGNDADFTLPCLEEFISECIRYHAAQTKGGNNHA